MRINGTMPLYNSCFRMAEFPHDRFSVEVAMCDDMSAKASLLYRCRKCLLEFLPIDGKSHKSLFFIATLICCDIILICSLFFNI